MKKKLSMKIRSPFYLTFFLLFLHLPSYADNHLSSIIIYGDNHRSEKSASGIKRLKEVAQDGTVYMALEGSLYGPIDGSQTVYGIESEMELVTVIAVKSYLMLYRSFNGLHGEEDYLIENISRFISLFIDQDPFTTKVWKEIPRPFQKDQDERLALFIDQILRADDPNNLFRQETPFVKNFQSIYRNHPNSFMNVAKVFALEVGKQVENLADPQKEILNNTIRNPGEIEHLFTEEIAVKWRDERIFENILKIYDLAQEDNKRLIVVIGCLHLDNLKEKLESFDKIKVEFIKGNWCPQ